MSQALGWPLFFTLVRDNASAINGGSTKAERDGGAASAAASWFSPWVPGFIPRCRRAAMARVRPAPRGPWRVFDQIGSATIAKAVCIPIHQIDGSIARAEKQRPRIRRHQSGVERGFHSPAFHPSKIKQFWATLCLHRRVPECVANMTETELGG